MDLRYLFDYLSELKISICHNLKIKSLFLTVANFEHQYHGLHCSFSSNKIPVMLRIPWMFDNILITLQTCVHFA